MVGAPESRLLNCRFRGRDRPTNVLSFPAAAQPGAGRARPGRSGDLPAGAARGGAGRRRKPLRAHWAHLVVHGTLHLLGYDHERARDARRMERREIAVLRGLGFANPYRSL